MSNSPWCDLISKGDFLKLHDMCPNTKRNCQKQITITEQNQLGCGGFRI